MRSFANERIPLKLNSTARLVFVGREFLTCSSLSLTQSSFCFRVLSCSDFLRHLEAGSFAQQFASRAD